MKLGKRLLALSQRPYRSGDRPVTEVTSQSLCAEVLAGHPPDDVPPACLRRGARHARGAVMVRLPAVVVAVDA